MKKFFFIIIFSILIYSRFVGLNWGLPYPMHPDERNMANAIQGLNCVISNFEFRISNFRECGNPHFFAYGQFPLYVGYLLVQIYHFIIGRVGLPIAFEEAVMSLRVISTVASIINVFVLVKIVELLISNVSTKGRSPSGRKYQRFSQITNYQLPITFLIFTFSPYFIQFSHFGTTEALLMLFYSLIILCSLLFISDRIKRVNILFLSLFSGLATATKVSAIIFVVVPIISIILNVLTLPVTGGIRGVSKSKKQKTSIFLRYMLHVICCMFLFLLLTAFFAILFSPHNLISFREFLGSMNYESAVALGDARVFYTRQFEYTVPILLQAIKIFPYTLGWPQYILAILGLFLLSWRKKEINLLRLAFLIYFIPNAFFYAKWTRFMTPISPIMSIFAVLFLYTTVIPHLMRNLYKFFWIPAFAGMTIMIILPGLAYLSIYQNPDVRFVTSKWIYKNIPEDSYILYETANVVDIPIEVKSDPFDYTQDHPERSRTDERLKVKSYKGISFNFYDLDSDLKLREELKVHLSRADYIFIPSRRVFANHTCLSPNIILRQAQAFDSEVQARRDDTERSQVPSGTWRSRSVKCQISKIFKNNYCEQLERKYPLLNDYYERLFSGRLGFKKVIEFSSYPKITLFGKTLVEFPDENAEETWTVFDHPVIRIYKRI